MMMNITVDLVFRLTISITNSSVMSKEASKQISPADYTKSRIAEIRSRLYSQHCGALSTRKYTDQIYEPQQYDVAAKTKREARQHRDYKDAKQNKQHKDVKEHKDHREHKDHKGHWEHREHREYKYPRQCKQNKQNEALCFQRQDERMMTRRKERREGRSISDMCQNRVKEIDNVNNKIKEVLKSKRDLSHYYSSNSSKSSSCQSQSMQSESYRPHAIVDIGNSLDSLYQLPNSESIEYFNLDKGNRVSTYSNNGFSCQQSVSKLNTANTTVPNFISSNFSNAKFTKKPYKQHQEISIVPVTTIPTATATATTSAKTKTSEQGGALRLANTISHMLQIDRKLRKGRQQYSNSKTVEKREILKETFKNWKKST